MAGQVPVPNDVAGGGDTEPIRVEERSTIDLSKPNDDHLETVIILSQDLHVQSLKIFGTTLTVSGFAECCGDGRLGTKDEQDKGGIWPQCGTCPLPGQTTPSRFCDFSYGVLPQPQV